MAEVAFTVLLVAGEVAGLLATPRRAQKKTPETPVNTGKSCVEAPAAARQASEQVRWALRGFSVRQASQQVHWALRGFSVRFVF